MRGLAVFLLFALIVVGTSIPFFRPNRPCGGYGGCGGQYRPSYRPCGGYGCRGRFKPYPKFRPCGGFGGCGGRGRYRPHFGLGFDLGFSLNRYPYSHHPFPHHHHPFPHHHHHD